MRNAVSSDHVQTTAAATSAGNPVGRNIGFLTMSQVITWSLTAVWTLFVPRLLGPAGVGLLVVAWAASGIFVAVGGLGLQTLLVREIAAAPERAPRLLGAAYIVRGLCIIPCLALTVIYLRLGHFEGERALVLVLAAATAIVYLVFYLLQAGFQAIERMQYLAYSDIINKAVFSLGGIALVLAGFGPVSLVTLLLVAAVVVLVLNVSWSRRYFTIDWRTNAGQVWSVFTGSLPYWAFAVFLSIYTWIDSAMLAVMASPAEVGWYGVPTRLFGTLLVVPTILSTAWLPRLVAAFTHYPESLKPVARTMTEMVMILSLAIGIGAALIAGPLITLLYGSAYEPSVAVFVILALTVIPVYVNMSIYQLLVASQRQQIWMWVMAASCIVNPLLNFVLIRAFQARSHNGALGAALSLLLTELMIVTVGIVLIRHLLYAQSLYRLGRTALAAAGMAAVVASAARFGLAAELVAGALSFGLFALLLRVVSLEQLREVLRRASWLGWRLGVGRAGAH